ncbi:TPA: DUF3270 domain-containing protein [Streptococcus agalactiae]|nr:DUF3270 domain-containing protein [Streptococcus agalactiae]
MSSPLKQEQTHESKTEQAQPKFQVFQVFQEFDHSAKLRELVFFARIALFSITTVLISFLLLALSLTPVWSFLLAMLASLAVTSAVSSFIWSLRQ